MIKSRFFRPGKTSVNHGAGTKDASFGNEIASNHLSRTSSPTHHDPILTRNFPVAISLRTEAALTMAKPRKLTINTDNLDDDVTVRELKAFIEQKLKDSDEVKAFVQDFRESTEIPRARHPLGDVHIPNVCTAIACDPCSVFCKIYRSSFGTHRSPVQGHYASPRVESPKRL